MAQPQRPPALRAPNPLFVVVFLVVVVVIGVVVMYRVSIFHGIVFPARGSPKMKKQKFNRCTPRTGLNLLPNACISQQQQQLYVRQG